MSGEQETITREERLSSGSETNNNHLFARGTLYGFADAKGNIPTIENFKPF